MESPEQIKARAEAALPGVKIDIVPNGSPSRQLSLLIDNKHALAVARFLRDDLALRLDFCSNVTGIDWLDRTVKKTVKVKKTIDGEEKEVDQTTEEKISGYLDDAETRAGGDSYAHDRPCRGRAFAFAHSHLAQR